jgi:membrane protease YdiL (CAAX protease family)
VIGLSALWETLIICGGPGELYLPLMWTPAFAGIIATLVAMKETGVPFELKCFLNRIGFRTCPFVYIALGLLIPLVYLQIPYMIYWTVHPENFAYRGDPLGTIYMNLAPAMLIGILPSLVTALGEEIGWRGYMVRVFREKLGIKKAVLFTSLFWALWHFPLLRVPSKTCGC